MPSFVDDHKQLALATLVAGTDIGVRGVEKDTCVKAAHTELCRASLWRVRLSLV